METGYHFVLKKRHAALIALIFILFWLMGCTSPSLHRVILQGNTESAKNKIRDGEDLEKIDKRGCTALHYSSLLGNEEVTRLLLENNVDINAKNKINNTPLILAARKGHIQIVKLLVENGAKINLQNKGGETALHNGALNGHIDVVRYLIKNNADVNMLTTDLRSPLHYSMLNKDHKKIAMLLIESGAGPDLERTCMDDTRYIYRGKDVLAAARIYKLAGEKYFENGMHGKAIASYKASALLFHRSSAKFEDLSKQQKSKEERAKFINILSGIGYIGAAGTGTSSTWAFENTDKYKNMSEVYHDTSILCEKYSVQCTSIVECYEKYSVGDELENCVSKLQAGFTKTSE